ncbi:hypothetical protein F5B21DRAFT_492508, partial [Xylaria acuta]
MPALPLPPPPAGVPILFAFSVLCCLLSEDPYTISFAAYTDTVLVPCIRNLGSVWGVSRLAPAPLSLALGALSRSLGIREWPC